MLDWMKGKIGRKGASVQRLAAGEYKDDPEKQALLQEVANEGGLDGEALIPLLTAKDAVVQQRGLALFLTRADADAAAALLKVAAATEGMTRPQLVKALGRVKAPLVQQAIDDALLDKVPERNRSAWLVAVELSAEHSDRLLERALDEGPPQARVTAMERLLKARSADALRARLVTSAQDRDARVRKLAVEALATLEGDDVFEAMLDRLSNEDDKSTRQKAGQYLQNTVAQAPPDLRPTILGRLLLSGDTELQSSLLQALFGSGPVGELLLEILTFCKTILGIQHKTVMSALQTLGEPVLIGTVPLLKHEDADIRVQALLLLERFQDPRVVGSVVKSLGDTDWWVRIMATEVLGRLKDARVVPHLERILGDADAKWAAIDALGNIGDEGARVVLTTLLGDAQAEVRGAAVSALAKIPGEQVDQSLEQVSQNDASLDIRIRAVELVRERRGGGAEAGTALTSDKITSPIDKLLAQGREASASDIHLSPGEPPLFRVDGKLSRVAKAKPLSGPAVEKLLGEILDSVRKPILERTGSVDFCYAIAGVGRYRVNCYRQQRGMSAAFRCVPNVAPVFADLGLPKALETVSTFHQGIVLVTGPAGSGKSTTLTALINAINESRQAHVLTLEDPIEFVHQAKKALINQREIGRDSKSFAASMRAALREDPDVIVVGEMRDRETIRLALLAAETGHLVIATMQTTSAVATIDKLVESFPTDEQAQVRVGLSTSMKLVVSQVLVAKEGGGRVAAFEILKTTSGIRAMIREGKTFQIPSAMQIGRGQGMRVMDESLQDLYAAGTISLETAIAHAEKKDAFDPKRRGAAKAEGKAAEERPSGMPPEIPSELTRAARPAQPQAGMMTEKPRQRPSVPPRQGGG